jgi:nitrite reductase/ring-hydroxylating ferredoxin subunit/DMSO/TMAO reductase YedYZ heme-binding membrane subunit
MSLKYAAVKWNRYRLIYDAVVLAGVVLYLVLFVLAGRLGWMGRWPLRFQPVLIRALGTCAFLLLHTVLCIGPLARLNRHFLPLLRNRRHLGVITFGVALAHAVLVVGRYYGFSRGNPLVSLLGGNTNYTSWTAFPFQVMGLLALVILFLLAATSHDIWQKTLSPRLWKGLHMLVYPAYGLLVVHVALGAHQAAANRVYVLLLGIGAATVISLHLAAGLRECIRDARGLAVGSGIPGDTWVDVGSVDEIPDNRGKTVCLGGRERVAVFRYDRQVSAVTNVCAHQRGPLGEGAIIDGCITCPWHGWEYRPQDGQAPPPFTEKIATYRVRVEDRRILLNPEPLPPGTAVEPARFETGAPLKTPAG